MRGVRRAASLLGVIAAPLLAVAFTRAQSAQEAFPHERHAGLFPLCTGCHAGMELGSSEPAFPPPALCARCHDGDSLRSVVWEGPHPTPDNLAFDHVRHRGALARAGDADPGCAGCHGASAEQRMRVASLPDPKARCLTCHAHTAAEHTGDADCATCHVPLAESGFARARIAALPKPPDHDSTSFLDRIHGSAAAATPARCATCHVRERCTACHVDAAAPALAEVPRAPAAMELPELAPARYPRPATHAAPEWVQTHGARPSRAACGTCHARTDCTLCHQRTTPQAVRELPEPVPGGAPGAGTRMRAPQSHAAPGFAADHGGAAAAQGGACATCHTPGFCVSCHAQAARAPAGVLGTPIPPRVLELLRGAFAPAAARIVALPARAAPGTAALQSRPGVVASPEPGRGGFHPPNFAARHVTSASGQTMECANCHSVEAFCRACHQESGLVPATRAGPGFHDATPVWLLSHGQPARQGLETCASCHRQSDCVQCHSTVGSFRVSPHGSSFDAARGWARAPETCLVCHLQKPL